MGGMFLIMSRPLSWEGKHEWYGGMCIVAMIENKQDDDGDVKAWPTAALWYRSAFLQLPILTVFDPAGPERDRVAVAAL